MHLASSQPRTWPEGIPTVQDSGQEPAEGVKTMDFKRLQAERMSEMDEALLREVATERARVTNRVQMVLAELEGQRRAVEELLGQIHEREQWVESLRGELASLDRQTRDISEDRARWLQALGGGLRPQPESPKRGSGLPRREQRVLREWPGHRLSS